MDLLPADSSEPSPAQAMLADLALVLAGPLAPFRAGLVVGHQPDAVALRALLAPDHLAAIVAWFDRRFGRAVDRRAVVSIWAAWHFTAVLPPLLAANVLLDRSPVLVLDRLGFVLSPDRRADAIVLCPDVADVAGLAGPDRFQGLVRSYLAPLIAHVAARAEASERVLWSNAGNTFDAFLRKIEPEAAGREGFRAARGLLAMPVWPDGWANPVFDTVHDRAGRRRRRVCCLRVLLPDAGLCDACPIEQSETGATPG